MEGVPSCRTVTRQSTLDITASLLVCQRHTSGWVVLVKDNNTLCDWVLDYLVTTLSRLDCDVALAKFTPFSTGISFPVAKVGAYVDYSLARLKTHQYYITRIQDWGGGGRLYTHPACLFKHVGRVSTQEYRNSKEYMALYAKMWHYKCA